MQQNDPYLRFLPSRIDWFSKTRPSDEFALFCRSAGNPSAGLEIVNYKRLANAINNAAWWLDANLPQNCETLCYYGCIDIRWSVIWVAALKTNRKVLFASGYAEASALQSLFKESNCSTLLMDSGELANGSNVAKSFMDIPNLKHFLLPSLQSWLDEKCSSPYSYQKVWEQNSDEIAALFHTGGTTGHPKIIEFSHKRIAAWLSVYEWADSDPHVSMPDLTGRRFVNGFGLWHVGGQIWLLFQPLYGGGTPVLGQLVTEVTSDSLTELLSLSGAKAMVGPPWIFQIMALKEKSLEAVRRLDCIIFAGAMLPLETGSTITKDGGPRVHNLYGCTENVPQTFEQLAEDHRYLRFHPKSGAYFEYFDHGLFELVIKRNREIEPEWQPVFLTWPDLEEYRSRDLFAPHVHQSDFWIQSGRCDDFVKLANGQMGSFGHVEAMVTTHPSINSAIVGGKGRARPFLLLESSEDSQTIQLGSLRESLWPYVERANKLNTDIMKIRKELIIISNTPFIRTAKGTVQRWSTLDKVEPQIDAAYERTGLCD